MAKNASAPDQRVILKRARKAGCTIVDTSDGWRVLLPDGRGMVTMHSSSSDHNAIKNMYADFKRAGLDLSVRQPKMAAIVETEAS